MVQEQKMKHKMIILVLCAVSVYSCASIKGTVMPLEGGQYKAISLSDEKKDAYKIAENDAAVTCDKDGKDKYVVISQEVTKEADSFNTGNSLADAALSITKSTIGLSSNKEYEVVTVFKCQ